MKRIILDVSDNMFRKISDTMVRDGFFTRTEFLRFLIVTYFKRNNVDSSEKNENMTSGVKDEQEDFKYALSISPKEIEEIKKRASGT